MAPAPERLRPGGDHFRPGPARPSGSPASIGTRGRAVSSIRRPTRGALGPRPGARRVPVAGALRRIRPHPAARADHAPARPAGTGPQQPAAGGAGEGHPAGAELGGDRPGDTGRQGSRGELPGSLRSSRPVRSPPRRAPGRGPVRRWRTDRRVRSRDRQAGHGGCVGRPVLGRDRARPCGAGCRGRPRCSGCPAAGPPIIPQQPPRCGLSSRLIKPPVSKPPLACLPCTDVISAGTMPGQAGRKSRQSNVHAALGQDVENLSEQGVRLAVGVRAWARYEDTNVSVESSTGTSMPHDLHGWVFGMSNRRRRSRRPLPRPASRTHRRPA